MKSLPILLLMFGVFNSASAQFSPTAGLPGSTAIFKDSSIFIEWATDCVLHRGYMDIATPDSGYANIGNETSAIGAAGQNGVASLGDGGIATLTFQNPIYNGAGFDFAVFENGFYTSYPLAFLELAFVEVSSDGTNFFRFPATSNIQDTAQIPMTGIDCSLINNLAGKYVFGYGTPFDLEELKNEQGLDVNHITHVRIIDVVGAINNQFAAYDQYNHPINDPYPTMFPSGGFDLDAVGVIHSTVSNNVNKIEKSDFQFSIFPNPVLGNNVHVNFKTELLGEKLKLYNSIGELVIEEIVLRASLELPTKNLTGGIYFLSIGNQSAKLIIE